MSQLGISYMSRRIGFRVDDLAESLLKKLPTETLVNDKTVVERLMKSYLGTEAEATKTTDPFKIVTLK